AFAISWSADSEWILFSVTYGDKINRGLWVVRPDGSGLHQLRKPSPADMCVKCEPSDQWVVRYHNWSPNSDKITLIVNVHNNGYYIAIYDNTAAHVDPIYHIALRLSSPSLSPVGKRIEL